MDVVCPACKKQHAVSEQMAGKRAKCGCGQVITIPALPVPQPAADDWLSGDFDPLSAPVAPSQGPLGGIHTPASGRMGQTSAGPILFQCPYGVVRPWFWGLMGLNLIIATFAIWAGFFWNTGWSINNVRLPPMAATVLFECLGFGMWSAMGWFLVGYFMHFNNPRRVAVTASAVIVPGGHWSTAERSIPWAGMSVRYMTFWPMQQLQFKQGWRSLKVLVSAQFATDDDFETIVGYVRQHGKL